MKPVSGLMSCSYNQRQLVGSQIQDAAGNRRAASEVLSPLKAAAVITSSRLHHASSLIALQESCLLCVLTSTQCANALMEIMMHTLRRFLLQGFYDKLGGVRALFVDELV